jgi:predicted ATPase
LLDLRFKLPWQGRRTALPRQRTLNATFDWSYKLLTEDDQRVLRRLSVFVGTFTLEAAQAIVAEPDTEAEGVIGAVANLISKSLLLHASEPCFGPLPPARHDTPKSKTLRCR